MNKFVEYFESKPEKEKVVRLKPIYKTKGIWEEFKQLNNPDNIKNSLGSYLLGTFKYESNDRDFIGVKFQTGRWFSRNLSNNKVKIGRNSTCPCNSGRKYKKCCGRIHYNYAEFLF